MKEPLDVAERAPVDLGQLGSVLGQVAGPLARMLFPAPPTPLQVLQEKLLAIRIAREVNDGTVPVAMCTFADVVSADRQDWVVCGRRGSGKTATAGQLAQGLSRAQGTRLVFLGWPPWAADALGGELVPTGELSNLTDAVVVIDEAGLRFRAGRRHQELYEVLALARQRGLSLVWTSQGTSGVPRDVLRMEVALAFKALDPIAAMMDREELTELTAQVQTIQERFPALREQTGMTVCMDGAWAGVSDCGLPLGWTEEVSKLWRHRGNGTYGRKK